jgi:DNA-binding MarR family transcriptional regulator
MVADRYDSERSLGIIVAEISRLARKQFDRRVRQSGLTRAQWLLLYHVARRPGSTQTALAERLRLEKITVSRQAERLARSGWIERRNDARDRRVYRLFVSSEAAVVVNRLSRVATALREEYFRGLPRSRRETLIDDLLHIKGNLLRMDRPPQTHSQR